MKKRTWLQRTNFPLLLGILIVSLVLLVAFKGPDLAPRDPLERNQITKVGDKYLIPPFPLFTPGFPLGSDQLGKDLFSGLLWAVRPTLTVVAVVSAIRLIIGTMVGLLAGWSFGRLSRFLDLVIAAAISVPVIIVALGCIAALGIDLGIWVFIVGLSVTGWVETARIVREQTEMIRGQVFIEAARSLGASNISILFRHVLRQIMGMIWMLFAFEISSSLMLTASLGFLGYYVGGDVWVMVSDTTAIATSSMPELGQMLAITKTSIAKPWPLFSLGGTIFIIVLGFTMLGEGLRQRINSPGANQNGRLARLGDSLGFWLEDKIGYPLSKAVRTKAFAIIVGAVLLAAVLGGGAYFWRDHQQKVAAKTIPPAFFSQSAAWASAGHDPYGSLWSREEGPYTSEIAWTLEVPEFFSGGPVVAADGTVYIVTLQGSLLAVEPTHGEIIWRHQMPAGGIGAPGIDEQGTIYAADGNGGISAVLPDGSLKWYFEPEKVNSAVTGPVVAPDGTIYYTIRGILRAVSAEGALRWEAFLQGIHAVREPVRLSPDGSMVYTSNAAFAAETGTPLDFPELGKMDAYFTGANGELYATLGHRIFHWKNTSPNEEVLNIITWDFQKFTVSTGPQSAGVAPDGSFWMFYTNFSRKFALGEDTRVVWLNPKGKILGNAHYATRNSRMIAIDNSAVIYTCGNLDQGFGALECQAFAREGEQPLWSLVLDGGMGPLGGALAQNRLYVASTGGNAGFLHAIGPGTSSGSQTPADAESSPAATGESQAASTEPISQPDDLLVSTAGEHSGPKNPQAVLLYEDEIGISGKTAIGADGTVYILSLSRGLLALDAAGTVLWERKLQGKPVKEPVISPEGNLYIADSTGRLYALNSKGEIMWEFQTSAEPQRAISQPAIGPDGTLYYTVGAASIQAVSPEGEGLWLANVKTGFFYRTPRPSLDGSYIYFHEEIFNAATGKNLPTGLKFQIKEFFDGQDGRHYLFTATTVAAWTYEDGGVVLSSKKVLSSAQNAQFAGVEESGVTWIAYTSQALWFTRDGQAQGNSFIKNAWVDQLAGVDGDYTIYLCGRHPSSMVQSTQPYCAALSPDAETPLWELAFGERGETVDSGIIQGDTIYISTDAGRLYLLKDDLQP